MQQYLDAATEVRIAAADDPARRARLVARKVRLLCRPVWGDANNAVQRVITNQLHCRQPTASCRCMSLVVLCLLLLLADCMAMQMQAQEQGVLGCCQVLLLHSWPQEL